MTSQHGRRRFLIATGAGATGALASMVGSATAAESVDFQRTFVSATGEPIHNSQIVIGYYDDSQEEYVRETLWTDEEGIIETTVPGGARLFAGFYKSEEDSFPALRLDGVPHIHTLDRIQVADEGSDSGVYQLPEAHRVTARAVFAERPGGVENAIPRFGSIKSHGWFASGYYPVTTNEDGYMKLKSADFTGVEMAGDTRIWMYPPGYEPYEEQGDEEYAPYAEETIRNLEVTSDTTIEIDISRRRNKANSNGE